MATAESIVIGGGVIGLSVARELAGAGIKVRVLERGELGREASWAGAGILPPASHRAAIHPYDQLRALSSELHPRWSRELLEETGIDNGFRRCGGIYVAGSLGEAAALRGLMDLLREENVQIESLDDARLVQLEPGLSAAFAAGRIRAAYSVPDEAQLRNPRHLQALIQSCRLRGVTMVEKCEVLDFGHHKERITEVITSQGPYHCDQLCLAGGAWSHQLLQKLNIHVAILPVRGQMVLFACQQPQLTHIINEGSRYLVPREDGRVLAGSTEEEAGFCKETTSSAINALTNFATQLVPQLREAQIERTWAGLRPGTLDGFPYLGHVPGFRNLFIAAGHFRSGIYLSPATAVAVAHLMQGKQSPVDLSPFSVLRN